MKVRLHGGRTDSPNIVPLLEALEFTVIDPGADRRADIALWNLAASPQEAAAELSDLLIERDPERLPRVVVIPRDQAQIERMAHEAGVEVVLRRPLSASILAGALRHRETGATARARMALPLLVLVAGRDEGVLSAFEFLRQREDLVLVAANTTAAIGTAIRHYEFDVCILAERLDGQGSGSPLFTRLRRAQPQTAFIVFDADSEDSDPGVDYGEATVVDGAIDAAAMHEVWSDLVAKIDRLRSNRIVHGEIADKQRELQRVNTTLRNINKAFRDANLRLEREGHVKDELIGVAAHELKSPLAAMKGALDMLCDGSERFEPEDASLLALLNRNTARMIKLVEDILDLARIEAGRMSLRPSEVLPRSLVDQAVQTVALRAQAKELRIELDEGAQDLAELDPERFVQMLINLLDNAVKFSPRKGLVKVMVRSAGGEIHFVVADSGPGIPEAERQSVFERFQHRSRGEDPHSGGSGLGLTITKAIAELHGGRITLGESPSGGAQFMISVPRRR